MSSSALPFFSSRSKTISDTYVIDIYCEPSLSDRQSLGCIEFITNELWRLKAEGDVSNSLKGQFGYWVAPLSLLTMRLETFTGSKSDRVRLVRQARSLSFQRASGVPISPPLSPLSARTIP